MAKYHTHHLELMSRLDGGNVSYGETVEYMHRKFNTKRLERLTEHQCQSMKDAIHSRRRKDNEGGGMI